MIKVGVVGCGAIGSHLVKAILARYKKTISFCGVCETDAEKVENLKRSLKKAIRSYSLEELVSRCDLVIEAASGKTAAEVVKLALWHNTDIMLMSVGGLLLNPQLLPKIRKKKINVYVPSGAVAGLDALKAARMGKIFRVQLTTKKPLAGLSGAPYINDNKINLNKIKKEQIIFEGTASEAVAGFPKNINVAAVLSLAGIGARKTRVRIVASRLVKRNIHTLEIEGNFGKIVCCSENVPSEVNPKTSMLAVLSALAMLEGITSNLKIGA